MASVINLLMIALCSVFGPGSELVSKRSTFCNPTIISIPSPNQPLSSYQSSQSSSSYHQDLNQILGPLKASQTLSVLIEGARRGMKECQKQFKDERWNCTPSEPDPSMQIFHSTITKGMNFLYDPLSVKIIFQKVRRIRNSLLW